jgi:cell division protein YceG involved in septum cleavage
LTQTASNDAFRVEPGETVASIANRLEGPRLHHRMPTRSSITSCTLASTSPFRPATSRLSPAQSIIDIAQSLQKFSPSDAVLVILPGWRMEEIAASLPTSGLSIDPQAFLAAANSARRASSFSANDHGRILLPR